MCKVMSRRWMGKVCWNPSQSYCPSSDIGISRATGPELVWGLEQQELGFQMQRAGLRESELALCRVGGGGQ